MLKLSLSDFTINPAPLSDHPIIQNLARFYVYDMSEFLGLEEGWEMPDDGLYECRDFIKYWEDENAFPFLIRYKNEPAGFAIVDKKGSDASVDFNMAQFFILRKFKNNGVGKFVAHTLFKQFPGVWEVMVLPGNTGAHLFWKSIISACDSNYLEETKIAPHYENRLRIIFKFRS